MKLTKESCKKICTASIIKYLRPTRPLIFNIINVHKYDNVTFPNICEFSLEMAILDFAEAVKWN